MNQIEELIKLANAVGKFADDNEKVPLASFSIKLERTLANNPGDYTIGMINRVINKMANSDKLVVSRAEIRDLYEKFYTRNTKFAHLFQEEMGTVQEEKQVKQEIHQEYFDASNVIESTDPMLAHALDQAFGGNTVKNYSANIAHKVEKTCAASFIGTGFTPNVKVSCYDDGLFVCLANFETPRGDTSVFVPVEVVGDAVITPEVFVGNDGPAEITRSNIVAYVSGKAGQNLKFAAQEIMKASILARGSDNQISDVDLAVSRMHQGDVAVIAPMITNVKVEAENPNLVVNLPKIEDPEITSMAKMFESELGLANYKFGKSVIASGNAMISREIEGAGIDNYQVALAGSDDNSMTYSVAINGGSTAFKVPVTIEAGKVLPPSVMICNGSVSSFDSNSINELVCEGSYDRNAALGASPLYGVKPSELVEIIRKAMVEENYSKAEDALNVLANSEDMRAYEKALQVYSKGLSKAAEIKTEASKCSMIIKSANSIHPVCGHTGLPLNKVCQDKHGQCMPKYRENMENSYEGILPISSKALF